MTWVELLGYVASALVVASLAMRSVVRLRVLSLIGALAFVGYGVLTGTWPVVVANAVIAVINIAHLRRELSTRTDMAAIPIDPDAPFLADFLAANADEISISQPDYHPSPHDSFVRLLTREGLPAGVLIGEPAGHELIVKLDYVTPAYRDSQIARWLFGRGRATFTEEGYSRLVTEAHTSVHRNYLEMVGFHHEGTKFAIDLA